MPLKSLVKVSHLSNLSDARYCAGMGVEMIGFQVIPGTEHYIAPETFQDIRGWIAGPRIVAELYGVTSVDQIETAIRTYAPDALELSFEEYQRFDQFLTLPCLISVKDLSQITQLSVINLAHAIAEEDTQCTSVGDCTQSILVKVTSVESLKDHLAQGCFRGFVLEGANNTAPGITDYDKLGALLEALEDEG